MLKKYIFLTIAFLTFLVNAQIISINSATHPETQYNAEDLVKEVLISGGGCAEISNFQLIDNPSAQYPNNNRSWGYFNKENSNFPFESGIILTSGYARRGALANTYAPLSDGNLNWSGHPILTTVSNQATLNATVFEFDFVPTAENISFNYVFASEEYDTYDCQYNDAFAFIISGPGIVNDPGIPGKNIARLPTGAPVSVETVNGNFCGNPDYFYGYNAPIIDTYPANGIQNVTDPHAYNGRSNVLTAESPVIPGETYRIRLMISDARDATYDSAVFLEAGSFNLGATITDEFGITLEDYQLVCDQESYLLQVNLVGDEDLFEINWYFNDVLIDGEHETSYLATEEGNYRVEIITELCIQTVDIDLTFASSPESADYTVPICTIHETDTYDLTLYEPFISSSEEGVIFQYYLDPEDANSGNESTMISDPTNYITGPTGQNTIYVKILSNENQCFNVVVLILDIIRINDSAFEIVNNECDNDEDGTVHFDLMQAFTSEYGTGVTEVSYHITFDEAYENINAIVDPDNYETTENETLIYVRFKLEDDICFSIGSIRLIKINKPQTSTWDYEICDDNGDGSAEFDLTQIDANIVESVTGLLFNYYINPEYALNEENPIENPEQYINIENQQIIYVTVRDESAPVSCVKVQPVSLIVLEFPGTLETEPFDVCDDLNDGVEIVDLTDNSLVVTDGIEDVILTYFRSAEDLENGTNAIGHPEEFEISAFPYTVHVHITKGECNATATLVYTFLNAPEVQNTTLSICSDDGYGTYNFNEVIENVIDTPELYTITYHISYQEALDGINDIGETYYNEDINQIIYVRVKNAEGCFSIAEIQLTYNDTILSIAEPYEECDEDANGFTEFDLTSMQGEIEELLGSSGLQINYYTSLENAYNNVEPIENQENYTNITIPQTIYAKVGDGNDCMGIVTFTLLIIETPDIEVPGPIDLCTGDDYYFQAEPGYETYTWYNPAGQIVSTTNAVTFDTAGIYELRITFSHTICARIKTVEVFIEELPVITHIEVEGTTVTVTATGTYPLFYSADGGLTWQESNIFYGIPRGNYNMLVKSELNCISEPFPFVVLDIKNFVSPNDDGYNDYWEIMPLFIYPGSTLVIYDRYGKILVNQSLENGYIWDGKYGGQPLPSTSYWYIIDLKNGQKLKGEIIIKNY